MGKLQKTIDKALDSVYINNKPRRSMPLEKRSESGFFYGLNMERRKKSIAVIDGQGGGEP